MQFLTLITAAFHLGEPLSAGWYCAGAHWHWDTKQNGAIAHAIGHTCAFPALIERVLFVLLEQWRTDYVTKGQSESAEIKLRVDTRSQEQLFKQTRTRGSIPHVYCRLTVITCKHKLVLCWSQSRRGTVWCIQQRSSAKKTTTQQRINFIWFRHEND